MALNFIGRMTGRTCAAVRIQALSFLDPVCLFPGSPSISWTWIIRAACPGTHRQFPRLSWNRPDPASFCPCPDGCRLFPCCGAG